MAVLRWYRQNGRTLPWRGEQDPYRVLVSEVMLQQTQVSRVLEKYPLFLKQFPTLRALARAERSSVIRAWRGMGYNNRAVRLHLLAQTVVNSHGGVLPRTEEELTLLPGIGRYTARALLSSVFHIPVPVVDVNVHRFFSRLFWPMRTLTRCIQPGRWHHMRCGTCRREGRTTGTRPSWISAQQSARPGLRAAWSVPSLLRAGRALV